MSDAPVPSNQQVCVHRAELERFLNMAALGMGVACPYCEVAQANAQFRELLLTNGSIAERNLKMSAELERLTRELNTARDPQALGNLTRRCDELYASEQRLRAALEDVASSPENRQRYYNFRDYMSHINGCKGGGDQACACGKASVAWNLDELVDGAERAFAVLEAARPDETKAEPL